MPEPTKQPVPSVFAQAKRNPKDFSWDDLDGIPRPRPIRPSQRRNRKEASHGKAA